MKNQKKSLKAWSASSNIIADDIHNLFEKYENGLSRYHEICHEESLQKIVKRWPLVSEIRESKIIHRISDEDCRS